MPLKTDSYWIERILSIKANNRRWGAGRITTQLEIGAEQAGRTDVPIERTVSRILAKEWSGLTDEEQAQYQFFHWPESMVRGDLPWEASAAALDLCWQFHITHKGRPSIRLVKWFWRVTLAAPDAPRGDRFDAASLLAVEESGALNLLDDLRGIEWNLAFAPWRSEERRKVYEILCRPFEAGEEWTVNEDDLSDVTNTERGEFPVPEPIPSFPRVGFDFQPGASGEAVMSALVDMMGPDVANRLIDRTASKAAVLLKQKQQENTNG